MATDDNLSGSEAVPAEAVKVELVPPTTANKEPSQAEKDWQEKKFGEAQERIKRRTWLFWGVSGAAITLFVLFLAYLLWTHLCTDKTIDHVLTWLLGALPVGLVFVLIKITSDPKKDEAITMWPDELIKLGNKAVDVVAEIAKKKFG